MTNLVLRGTISLEKRIIEEVHKYKYLGYEIQINRHNKNTGTTKRFSLGWTAYRKLRNVFKSNIQMNLKSKVQNGFVLPVMAYGTETLTLTKNTVQKLEVTGR